jgi:hypothetical protein
MKNPLARFRHAGSFSAGLLIGLSIMIPLFAMMATNPSDWQTVWLFGSLVSLALGLKLQALITVVPRHRRVIDSRLGILAFRFMESNRGQ